jgi:hypothetical protein
MTWMKDFTLQVRPGVRWVPDEEAIECAGCACRCA